MKTPVLLLGIVLAMLLAPAGHGARHPRCWLATSQQLRTPPLLPLRVLRSAQPPKAVHTVAPAGGRAGSYQPGRY